MQAGWGVLIHPRIPWGWALTLLVGAFGGSDACSGSTAGGEDASIAKDATADLGRADAEIAPLPYRLGFSGVGWVNRTNADSIRQFFEAMGYADEDAYGDDVLARMQALSAPMARAEFHYTGGGTFVAAPESLHRSMRDAGFEIYGWFNPLPRPETESLDSDFDQALRQLVEDNLHIRHWQIGNEPDLLWDDPGKYPEFFKRSQRVIRQSCPDCGIVLAGISNQHNTSSDAYQIFDDILRQIAEAELPGRPFDVFDFHYYKPGPVAAEIAQAASDYRRLLTEHGLAEGVVLWCTETGIYTGDPPDPEMGLRTEEQQAAELARLVAWMSAAGVQRIFYWTVVETWGGPLPGFFDTMGLVFNGLGGEENLGITAGTKKLAYQTFRMLSGALAQTGPGARVTDGVYRFDRANGPVFIIWDEAETGRITLTGIPSGQVRLRDLVPDAQGASNDSTLTVTDGSVSIPVDHSPKLVTIP
jgi:hypothetical protein